MFAKVNPERTLVVLEKEKGLSRLNFQIHRANNNCVKHFMKSEGFDDKTDKIDCRLLACYGREKCKQLKVDESKVHCLKLSKSHFKISNNTNECSS
ncbi:MAG: hypothetical protein LBC04_00050 [Holosporaceae bacterium]|nr:hypothetical protein [Holosporaceae bacterium]